LHSILPNGKDKGFKINKYDLMTNKKDIDGFCIAKKDRKED